MNARPSAEPLGDARRQCDLATPARHVLDVAEPERAAVQDQRAQIAQPFVSAATRATTSSSEIVVESSALDDAAAVDPHVGDRLRRHRVDDALQQIVARAAARDRRDRSPRDRPAVRARCPGLEAQEPAAVLVPSANAVSADSAVPSSSRTRWSSEPMRISSNTQRRLLVQPPSVPSPIRDARAQHLGDPRDAVAQEHVGAGTVGEPGAARAHQRDLLVVEPHAVHADHARPEHAEPVQVADRRRRRARAASARPRTVPRPRGCETRVSSASATSQPARIMAGDAPCGLWGAGWIVDGVVVTVRGDELAHAARGVGRRLAVRVGAPSQSYMRARQDEADAHPRAAWITASAFSLPSSCR